MSNLLKMGYTTVSDGEKRMIDTNELVAKRIEQLAEKMAKPENQGFMEDGEAAYDEDGFSAGLDAETVEGLLTDPNAEGSILKETITQEERDRMIAESKGAAEAFLLDAQTKARAEADRMLTEAREQIAKEREEALSGAFEQGYQEGLEKAEAEYSDKRKTLEERERTLEAGYEELVEHLEEELVSTIGQVYEHLIGVELSSYKKVLIHLISTSLRKIEGKDLLVHVSSEDYPLVSMEKKQLMSFLSSPSATLELIEDITLKHNECMIEAEGGIFDCGLGTQLNELKQKLRLLSFERE